MDAAAAGVSASATFAGFWRRVVGSIIDGIIVSVIYGVLAFIFKAVAGDSGTEIGVTIGGIIGIVYILWGWARGQTIGCMAMNMRMANAQTGGAPGYGKAIVRLIVQVLLSIIGILALIGDLWMIWDSKKQTWQDKAAGTVVVKV